MDLFIGIGVAWVVGMAGYIWIGKFNKYNNKNYINVSQKIIKYKKINERTSIKK